MRRARGGVLLLTWGIGAAALGSSACETVERHCTQVGCQSREQLAFILPRTAFTEAATIELCRNDQCWQSQLPASGAVPVQYLSLTDDGDRYGELWLEPTANSFTATANVFVQDYSDVAIDDVLRVTFSDSSGTALLAASGTIRSTSDNYPNRRDCDLSPCRQGTAEITSP
ncbi:MAG: hypothetical protein WDO74_25335 [Pseudomonadota bacterium]